MKNLKKGQKVELVYRYGCSKCGGRQISVDSELLIQRHMIFYNCEMCGVVGENIEGKSDEEVSERLLGLLWYQYDKNEADVYDLNGKKITTIEI